MSEKPYIAHVCPHTHWDREWYSPFQTYRMRLVRLMDHLLDTLEQDSDFRLFNLDGQTIPLTDYLEIRPENETRLRNLISDGRIIIGPWFTMPDEKLLSVDKNNWFSCQRQRRSHSTQPATGPPNGP